MSAALSIDHLVLSVPDLGGVVRGLRDLYGLDCYRLPGRADDTAVCPLGGAYLRVVHAPDGPASFGWVVSTADLDPFIAREGAPRACSWEDGLSGVGVDLVGDGLLPPVVARRPRWLHPSGYHVYSPARPVGITCLELQGEIEDLRGWLGDAVDELPLKVTPGARALLRVTVATVEGDKHLTSTALTGAASLAAAGGGRQT